ncbi:hypothetical protein RRG08_015113 [Elysia crispata]|uniref:Uncharacterized protein n=1 Tax=Elysia crispata TaxID=231223 RepID=A0AAE1DG19_9GAST|nr:hypothetical protein RRG08_015113 [Elysia crispata]
MRIVAEPSPSRSSPLLKYSEGISLYIPSPSSPPALQVGIPKPIILPHIAYLSASPSRTPSHRLPMSNFHQILSAAHASTARENSPSRALTHKYAEYQTPKIEHQSL